jgi:hypothetical protein
VPRILERDAQATLMARACAGLAPRLDLAAIGKITVQTRDILVVDLDDMIDTKRANFAPPCIAPTTTEAPAAPITAAVAKARPIAVAKPRPIAVAKARPIARALASLAAAIGKAGTLARRATAIAKSWSLRRALGAWGVSLPTLGARILSAWGLIFLSFHTAPHSCGYRRLSSGDDACRHVCLRIAHRH